MDVICVTQSSLCGDDFLNQIEKICESDISRIILREKSLTCDEYKKLATQVQKICHKHNVPLSLHSFINVATQLQINSIHISFQNFMENLDLLKNFTTVGVSVHSKIEAQKAETHGAKYITAGHIFPTDCKKGLQPKGVDFLENICKSTKLKVYAIGGISPKNITEIKHAGADGACLMSSLMLTKEPKNLVEQLKI